MAGEELHVLAGPAAGTRIPVAEELELGREVEGPGGLGEDPRLSRRHARLWRSDEGALCIEDLGSANGTAVNGEPLRDPRRLSAGDRIEAGATTLELRGPGAAHARVRHPAGAATPPTGERPLMATASAEPIAGTAELLHAGRRLPIAPAGTTVGRDPDCDVVVSSPRASRLHARVEADAEAGHVVVDLGSGNGTYLDGRRLHGTSRALRPGDTIAVGDDELRYVTGQRTRLHASTLVPAGEPRRVDLTGPRLRIGRDAGNDLVLEDPNVSRFHAEVVVRDDVPEVRDLGSRNGTRVNGRPVARAPLVAGAQVTVGPYRLTFDGAGFLARDDRGALRLDAEEVTVRGRGGREILRGASVSVQPGEFVVVIGESGSGKSTLVKALAGVGEPAGGRVRVNGEPVTQRLTDLGYVPQDEIVHGRLTVREALRYAARLRLPQDTTRADLEATVARVAGELGLEDHADARIDTLSGGQRKRAGVAVELLSRPSLVFLDEPTSGLDPALESRMMELFRSLAERGTRAVVVVTHATRNLRLCDRLVVMGRGGHLCFQGAPEEALAFFGVEDYDDIYLALEREKPERWRAAFEVRVREHENAAVWNGGGGAQPPTARLRAAERDTERGEDARPRVRALTQWRVLSARYARLMARDRRNLALLVGQAPLIGVGIALLFAGDVFSASDGGAAEAAQLLFLLVVSAIWLGAVDGSREIVKERGVARREWSVGVRVGAYLGSKVAVLLGLSAVQTALLGAVVLAVHPLDGPGSTYLELGAVLLAAGFAAVGMGLVVSALAEGEDQATSVIPLALIPQLLFAGAIVAVARMSDAVALISNLAFSRWALAGSGAAVDMNERLAADRQAAAATGYGPDFFTLSLPAAVLVLGTFLALMLGVTGLVLARRR